MLIDIIRKLKRKYISLHKFEERVDNIDERLSQILMDITKFKNELSEFRKFIEMGNDEWFYRLNNKIDDIYVLNKKLDDLNASMELVKWHATNHPLYLSREQEFLFQMCKKLEQTTCLRTNKRKFVLFNYRSHLPEFSITNLGDYIQTIAVRMALEKIYKNDTIEFDYFDRDSLSFFENADNERATVVMQGWFSHSFSFLPNKFLNPVYVGVHFNSQAQLYIEKLLSLKPDLFKDIEIGCRDYSTLCFCKRNRIAAYYSRCLTLTFPVRPVMESQKKVFFVNIPESWNTLIPLSLRTDAVRINQRKISSDCESWWDFLENAEVLLERYRTEARLVITTALHCASPCLAMGIPVILFAENPKEDLVRFSALEGLIEIKTIEDLLQGKVNFNPSVVDLKDLKKAMMINLRYELNRKMGVENIDVNIAEARALIASFRCI